MTNKILFIANWKMFGTLNSLKSINKIIKISKKKDYRKAKIIYCPPYTLLDRFVRKIKNSNINVGAQNCHSENTGAFTGSVSASMIKSTGAKYVIIGHSENRNNADDNRVINKKILIALLNNLQVILCFGETISEKKKNKTKFVLKNQLISALKNVRQKNKIIFAYEPVWSIGTGKVLNNKDLKKQFLYLKTFIKSRFKIKKPILVYGGSVNNLNIINIKNIKEIDGFLVGGASTNSNKFVDIIKKTIN